MTGADDEPSRVVFGGSEAGLRRTSPTDGASFEAALETVRIAAERSFSGEEIRALGIVARRAMVYAADRPAADCRPPTAEPRR
jgi:hypothetical protein